MGKLWRGPKLNVKRGRPNELWFTSIDVGQTVVKKDGQWRTLMTPQSDFLATCDVVLRGGYTIEITDDLADELTAAGFGQYVSES